MTARADFTPPALSERFDGFSYDYRMRCECGGAVDVTDETYYREQSAGAMAPCDYCGGQVYFGPAAALLRDDNDPALGDVNRFAWYHTSTWADWPSENHRREAEAVARQAAEHFCLDAERVIERATTKALHLGTYEAAIENMLRRMRNQADGASQFFLYRTAVQVEPGRINDGYRDENDEPAAQLRLSDLDEVGLDAIRYLNVHEATRSLSLAVRPGCLLATQCIPIPVDHLVLTPSAELAARLVQIEALIKQHVQEQAGLPRFDQLELIRMRTGEVPDPDGIAERTQEVQLCGYRLWANLQDALSEEYLGDISPVVTDDFRSAVSSWRRQSDEDGVTACAERFALLASLLTRSSEVVHMVSRQPWRELQSVPFEQ